MFILGLAQNYTPLNDSTGKMEGWIEKILGPTGQNKHRKEDDQHQGEEALTTPQNVPIGGNSQQKLFSIAAPK